MALGYVLHVACCVLHPGMLRVPSRHSKFILTVNQLNVRFEWLPGVEIID